MKIFTINYGYHPSGSDTTIIIAESKDRAVELAGHVTREPKSQRECNYDYIEFQVVDVPLSEGVVYEGYSCC